MEHLFTPWRMEYIRSAKDPGCIFCDMLEVQDDRTALILHRDALAFLVLNKYPYNNGHFMAVPYRHLSSLDDLSPDEAAGLMSMVTLSMRLLRAVYQPDGFNIGANVGKVAGAGVEDHVHMHIVPRWEGDTNYMSVMAGTRLIPQALDETYDLLKPPLDDLLRR